MKTLQISLTVIVLLFTACGGGGSSNSSIENEKHIDTRQSAINAYVVNLDAADDLIDLTVWLDRIIYNWSNVTTADLSRSAKSDLPENRMEFVKKLRTSFLTRGVVENDVVSCPEGGTMIVNGNAISTDTNYEYTINIVFDHCYIDTSGYLSGTIKYHDKYNGDTYDVETEFINFTMDTNLPQESHVNGMFVEQYTGMDSEKMTFDGTVSNDDSTAIYKNYNMDIDGNIWEVEGQIEMSSFSSYPCSVGIFNVQTPKPFRNDSYNGVITINNATYTFPDAPSEGMAAPSFEREVLNGTDIIKVEFNGETVDVLKSEFEYACTAL